MHHRPGGSRVRRLLVGALLFPAIGCKTVASSSFAPLPAGGHHVLFIGNSLTYFNDLPGTLISLAASAGDTIRAAQVAYPDFNLADHVAQGDAPRAIATGGWEYVILQQGPSSIEVNRQDLINSTRYYDQLIRLAGARTALYMVWPDIAHPGDFPRAIDSYALAAQAVNGLLLPVGAAWQTAWQSDATLPFYSADGLHPSALLAHSPGGTL